MGALLRIRNQTQSTRFCRYPVPVLNIIRDNGLSGVLDQTDFLDPKRVSNKKGPETFARDVLLS